MKFRAHVDSQGLRLMTSLVQTVDKLSDECVVYLTPDSLELRKPPCDKTQIELYVKLDANELFDEYVIASRAKDTIGFLVRVKNLVRGLRSAEHSDGAVFKLTKKQDLPCFSIESTASVGLDVTQDVPIIQLLSQTGMLNYKEPQIPAPSHSISLPDPRHIKVVLDRMKVLDKFVEITIRSDGTLGFKVRTECVNMQSVYQDLFYKKTGGEDEEIDHHRRNKRQLKEHCAWVNVAGFVDLFTYPNSNVENAIISIVRSTMVVVYVEFDDKIGHMTFYCPAIEDPDAKPEEQNQEADDSEESE